MSGGPISDTVLPPSGGWIIVKRRLPASVPQVPVMSLFWAMPEKVFIEGSFELARWGTVAGGASMRPTDLWQVYKARHTKQRMSGDERATAERLQAEFRAQNGYDLPLEMRVRIRAPDGDVCVEPYEWVPCSNVRPFIDEVGREVILHEYGDKVRARGWQERLFYLRSRGINRADAVQLLFGEVRSPNVMWLEVVPEVARCFSREISPSPSKGRSA